MGLNLPNPGLKSPTKAHASNLVAVGGIGMAYTNTSISETPGAVAPPVAAVEVGEVGVLTLRFL